jgi:hypothetical protein
MAAATRASIVAGAALLAACASDREVYLEVPLARLEPPTAAPRMLGIGLTSAGTARVELTPDQTTTTPTTDTPAIRHDHSGQLRFDVQPIRPVQISLRGFGDGLSGVQAKWLPLRPAPGEHVALAFTVAYAGGKRKFRFDGGSSPSRTDIEQTLLDGAMILGAQLGEQWLLFGGPYYSHLDYRGSYFSARGSSPDVNTNFDGLATAAGGNVALAWTPAAWVQLAAEYSQAHVAAGSMTKTVERGSVTLQFFFGPRIYEPGAESGTVKVVPPEEPAKDQ